MELKEEHKELIRKLIQKDLKSSVLLDKEIQMRDEVCEMFKPKFKWIVEEYKKEGA